MKTTTTTEQEMMLASKTPREAYHMGRSSAFDEIYHELIRAGRISSANLLFEKFYPNAPNPLKESAPTP